VRASAYRLPPLWAKWIADNAHEHYPELAAALRARSMHQAIAAGPDRAAPEAGAANRAVTARV